MFRQEFVRIFSQVKKLRLVRPVLAAIVFDELPVTLLDTTHAGTISAAIRAIHDITNGLAMAEKHRLETLAIICFWNGNAGEITHRG